MNRVLKIGLVAVLFFGLFGVSAYMTMRFLIKGEDTVVVPDLAGHDAVAVLKLLSDLGLNAKIKGSETHANIPENHVISQDPPPGTEIKSGRQVKVVMSRGPDTIVTPRLTGLHVQQALLILEDSGFCEGKKSHVSHPTLEKSQIIAQFPPPGVRTARTVCTDLLISTGPRIRLYQMPDLASLPIEDAIEIIEARNLQLGKIETVFHKGKNLRTVIGQDPVSGLPVAEKTMVNLVVNRMPGRKNSHFTEAGGFIRHRVQPGFLKRHVRVHLEGIHTAGDLFNEFVSPGEEVVLLVPTVIRATLRVYEDQKEVEAKKFH